MEVPVDAYAGTGDGKVPLGQRRGLEIPHMFGRPSKCTVLYCTSQCCAVHKFPIVLFIFSQLNFKMAKMFNVSMSMEIGCEAMGELS